MEYNVTLRTAKIWSLVNGKVLYIKISSWRYIYCLHQASLVMTLHKAPWAVLA